MDPTICFICERLVTEGESEFVGKGIPALVSASKARKDDKYKKLQKVEVVQIHKLCKTDYTNKKSLEMLQQSKKIIKMEQTDFDFKNNCFFCGKDFKREYKKPLNKRRRIHECTQPGIKEKLIANALKRNDELGHQILERITDVNLLSVGAHYHKDCNNKFFYSISKFKRGRPVDQTLDKAFEEVCDYINTSVERQFTLKSLLERVEHNLPGGGTMSMKTLQSKLQKKYGDGILFAVSRIKPSAIYFLDSGLKYRENLVKQEKT